MKKQGQHILPRFILQYFSDENDRVYTLINNEIKLINNKNVGKVNNLFEHPDYAEQKGEIENLFADYEGAIATCFKEYIPKVLNNTIKEEEINKLEKHIRLFYTLMFFKNGMSSDNLAFVDIASKNISLTVSEILDIVNNNKTINNINKINYELLYENVKSSMDIDLLASKDLILVEFDNSLITSNYPMVKIETKHTPEYSNEKSVLENVSAAPSVILYIPLTPKLGSFFVSSDIKKQMELCNIDSNIISSEYFNSKLKNVLPSKIDNLSAWLNKKHYDSKMVDSVFANNENSLKELLINCNEFNPVLKSICLAFMTAQKHKQDF